MAYQKKEFQTLMLYKDSRSIFESLPAETVKLLICSAFAYSFDDNPEEIDQRFESEELATKISWQVSRDKIDLNKNKFIRTSEANAEKGKKSGQQRLTTDNHGQQDEQGLTERTHNITAITRHNNTKNNRKIINDEFGFPIYEDTRERVTEHD